jgi:hypothetical protein
MRNKPKPRPLEELTPEEIHKLYDGIMRGIAEQKANMTKWEEFTYRFFWRYWYPIERKVRHAFHHRRG